MNKATADTASEDSGDHVKDHIDPHADLDWFLSIPPLDPSETHELKPSPRLAEALKTLRAQVNAAAPRRSKASDGWIGDGGHARRASDHNPWVIHGGKGIVTAIDITNDPVNGCDAGTLAEALRQAKDPRVKYIISKKRIASSAPKGSTPAWAWRTYTGANPHDKHVHISVHPEAKFFDSTADWKIESAFNNRELAQAEDPEAQIEAAVGALADLAGNTEVPLLVRLNLLAEGAEALLSAYSTKLLDHVGASEDRALEGSAPRYDKIAPEYRKMFDNCVIPSSKIGLVAWHRMMLLKGRALYEHAAKMTGVPWWFIGICHALEASFNFKGHLHNGDPLSKRTVQVPKGLPKVWNPPTDWVSSAVDALTHQGYAGAKDWSLSRSLYRWEAYNGWGTRNKGINTPYLWSFSNHYTKGKYVKDHVYDPNAVSKQCGAAVMLKALQSAGDVKL